MLKGKLCFGRDHNKDVVDAKERQLQNINCCGQHLYELANAFRMLCSVGADLMRNTFGHPVPPLPRHKPATLLSAVKRLHTVQYAEGVRRTADGVAATGCVSRTSTLDLAIAYLPYVTAVYKKVCPAKVGDADVIFSLYDVKGLWSPFFFVARDDASERFIVAIRGTKSLSVSLRTHMSFPQFYKLQQLCTARLTCHALFFGPILYILLPRSVNRTL